MRASQLFLVAMVISRAGLLAQPAGTTQTNAAAMEQASSMATMQHMQEMDAMAKSMRSMADTCRMMMEKEMRAMPVKIVATISLVVLLTVALILFIVLEIQWIRFWNVRNKAERLRLVQS